MLVLSQGRCFLPPGPPERLLQATRASFLGRYQTRPSAPKNLTPRIDDDDVRKVQRRASPKTKETEKETSQRFLKPEVDGREENNESNAEGDALLDNPLKTLPFFAPVPVAGFFVRATAGGVV